MRFLTRLFALKDPFKSQANNNIAALLLLAMGEELVVHLENVHIAWQILEDRNVKDYCIDSSGHQML